MLWVQVNHLLNKRVYLLTDKADLPNITGHEQWRFHMQDVDRSVLHVLISLTLAWPETNMI